MVNGPHDTGGAHGFGPVRVEADEPVFHEPWERTAFALQIVLAAQGRLAIDEFRFVREAMPPAMTLTAGYYELWLNTVQRMLEHDGLVTRAELDAEVARLREPDAEAHVREDPALTQRVRAQLAEGASAAQPGEAPPRFAVGEVVRTVNHHPDGHTRLPRYARDRRGTVEARYPAFPRADLVAHRRPAPAEPVYCVRFEAAELWGESAEPATDVRLDVWESFLRPEPERA